MLVPLFLIDTFSELLLRLALPRPLAFQQFSGIEQLQLGSVALELPSFIDVAGAFGSCHRHYLKSVRDFERQLFEFFTDLRIESFTLNPHSGTRPTLVPNEVDILDDLLTTQFPRDLA